MKRLSYLLSFLFFGCITVNDAYALGENFGSIPKDKVVQSYAYIGDINGNLQVCSVDTQSGNFSSCQNATSLIINTKFLNSVVFNNNYAYFTTFDSLNGSYSVSYCAVGANGLLINCKQAVSSNNSTFDVEIYGNHAYVISFVDKATASVENITMYAINSDGSFDLNSAIPATSNPLLQALHLRFNDNKAYLVNAVGDITYYTIDQQSGLFSSSVFDAGATGFQDLKFNGNNGYSFISSKPILYKYVVNSDGSFNHQAEINGYDKQSTLGFFNSFAYVTSAGHQEIFHYNIYADGSFGGNLKPISLGVSPLTVSFYTPQLK